MPDHVGQAEKKRTTDAWAVDNRTVDNCPLPDRLDYNIKNIMEFQGFLPCG